MSGPHHLLRQFWAMQILGWSAYASSIFIDILTRRRYPDAVAYDLHYQLFEAENARARQAEAPARSARLQALQLQLHPHFLFNTLNAISTLVVEARSDAANHMLGRLAAFLRLTLNDSTAPEIPLSKEVANVKVYLAIEKARLGERLEVEFSIAPDAEGALVPALLLQPLAENAIRHGITPRPEGGKLTIEAERAGTRLRVRVCDNGVGSGLHIARRGLGLANTIERLSVLYGNDHCPAVRWPDEGGGVVDVELPYSTSATFRHQAGIRRERLHARRDCR